MWLLSGTFDEFVDQNTKLKLLKPSTEYPYGRLKPNDPADKIVTTNKGVSRNEGIFTVSSLPDNLASDPALIFTPQNPVSKYMVRRNERDVVPETDQKFILMNGDMIIKGITITVINEPLFVFAIPSIDRDTVQDLSARARSLGIRVSRTWSHIATHYLIDEFLLVPPDGNKPPQYPIPWLCGLLCGAHFVSLAWLDALVKKGELPRGSGNLEETYDPPKEDDFVPMGSNPELWEPKDGRQRMFHNVRFIVLYDGDQLDKNFKKLIDAGGGTIQECSISSETALDTSAKWSQVIRKARSKRGVDENKASTLVLIGLQAEVLQAQEDWEDIYVEGAKEMDMRIVFEDDLALAILHADMAYVNCSLTHDLPQRPAAPSNPPSPVSVPRRKLVRSTIEEESFDPAQPSHQSSSNSTGSINQPAMPAGAQSDSVRSAGIPPAESQNEGGFLDTAPRPLPLRRRPKGVKPMKALLGFDDDSMTQDSPRPSESSSTPIAPPSDSITSPPVEAEYVPPNRPAPSRPKRKFPGGSSRQARIAELLGFGANDDNDEVGSSQAEPAYKKFKADFETSLFGGRETGEGTLDAEAPDEVIGDLQPPPIASQSQSGPLESASGYGTMGQSQSASRTQSSRAKTGLKRKIMSDIDEDEAMEADPSTSHTRASKRVAHSRVNVIESRSQSPPRDETPLSMAPKTVPGATFVSKGKSRGGATETGVDTAPQFLQALASMKKGKRKEDDFDREFNNLRITLPKSGPGVDLEKERERKEEMEAFDAFEKDMNLRGNFMVVIESDDILRKDGGRQESTPVVENGKPNFKKFKKKVPRRTGPLVEVFLDEAMDYGQGNGYWAKEPSPDIPIEANSIHPAPRPRGRGPAAKSVQKPPPKSRRALQVEDSDSDADAMPPPKPMPATAKGKAKAAATIQKDYEPNDSDLDFSDQEAAPRRSQRKAPAKIVVEEGSEEDFGSAMAAIGPDVSDSDGDPKEKSTGPSVRTTHAGSRNAGRVPSAGVSQSTVKSKSTTKSSGATKKRVRPNSDSDSDGVAFQGFSAKKKPRR